MSEKSIIDQLLKGERGLATVPNTEKEARLSAEFEQIRAEFLQEAQKDDASAKLSELFERAVKNLECSIVEVAENHFREGFSLGIKFALELVDFWGGK